MTTMMGNEKIILYYDGVKEGKQKKKIYEINLCKKIGLR